MQVVLLDNFLQIFQALKLVLQLLNDVFSDLLLAQGVLYHLQFLGVEHVERVLLGAVDTLKVPQSRPLSCDVSLQKNFLEHQVEAVLYNDLHAGQQVVKLFDSLASTLDELLSQLYSREVVDAGNDSYQQR